MKAYVDCQVDAVSHEDVVVFPHGGGIRQKTCMYWRGELVCVVTVAYPVGSAAWRAYMAYLGGDVGAGVAA